MHLRCKICRSPVQARFRQGEYHFHHCGRSQSVTARNLGRDDGQKDRTVLGAALGAVGAAAAALNPLGGVVIGARIGSAFNQSDRLQCRRCQHWAYPTGKRGRQGDRMYHCSNQRCRSFVFAR